MNNVTPGPWTADLANAVRDKEGKVIALAFDIERSRDEAQSNAHFIAAAPDLLHALSVILPMAKRYAHANNVGRNQEMVAWAEEIERKATELFQGDEN
ncbi:MAG: hypothetical protein ACR2RE_28170 [Geminicoccaceae bacterium]